MQLKVEAFDYLQLPVAVKEGRVGKLQIQVPPHGHVQDTRGLPLLAMHRERVLP